jgi:hypothetical protein
MISGTATKNPAITATIPITLTHPRSRSITADLYLTHRSVTSSSQLDPERSGAHGTQLAM